MSYFPQSTNDSQKMLSAGTTAIYGSYELCDKSKQATGLHVTVFYRNIPVEPAMLKKILGEFSNMTNIMQIFGEFSNMTDIMQDKPVKICGVMQLDGPEGQKNTIDVCKLRLEDEQLMRKLEEFSNQHSYRAHLSEQYTYTMHATLKNGLGLKERGWAVGDTLFLGDAFIKSLPDKKIILQRESGNAQN